MEYNIQEDRVQEERRGILSKLKVPKVNVARIGRPGFVLPSFFPDIRASTQTRRTNQGRKLLSFFLLKINIETFQVRMLNGSLHNLSYY